MALWPATPLTIADSARRVNEKTQEVSKNPGGHQRLGSAASTRRTRWRHPRGGAAWHWGEGFASATIQTHRRRQPFDDAPCQSGSSCQNRFSIRRQDRPDEQDEKMGSGPAAFHPVSPLHPVRRESWRALNRPENSWLFRCWRSR
jgi:hypothetical protein